MSLHRATATAASTSTMRCSCLCQAQIRAASTSSHPVRPPRTRVLPKFSQMKKSVDLPAPRVQKFENTVSLPNERTLTLYSTCPRPNIAVSRDVSNHPLWGYASTLPSGSGASASAPQDEEQAGRMGRFARRFGGGGQSRPAPQQQQEEASISPAQERAAVQMGEASAGATAGETEAGVAAARRVMKEQVAPSAAGDKQQQQGQAKAQEQTQSKSADTSEGSEDLEMFDLALEGEVFEESKHKIVEETGKKGKGKGGKGKGKK